MSKYLIIGDVHGNYQGAEKLVNRAMEYHKDIKLVFTGDYIDYWADGTGDGKKTIELMTNLADKNHCTFLLGNHDLWMLNWINQGNVMPLNIWYSQGGKETLMSYGIPMPMVYNSVKSLIPKEHIDFLQSLETYYVNDNIVVIHGGFDRESDMSKVKMNAPIGDLSGHSRYGYDLFSVLWDREFFRTRETKLLNSYKKIFGDRLFICGHTPYGVKYADYLVKRLLIDGDCKHGGSLHSALVGGNKIEKIITENDIYDLENLI